VDTGEARFTRTLLPAIVALSAVGYTATAPHWILGGDNGEFATMYAVGGIAHPPGYPSMVLWLRLWHWLPVDSPWRSEINAMRKRGFKVEMEATNTLSLDYLAEHFLPQRLASANHLRLA